MVADFSGYATKAGLECSDGKTIMPDAFKHQDGMQVPLVWQHSHDNPENVLGKVKLENRPDGVYGYAYFNNTPAAALAKEMVRHGDVNSLSIYANKLKMEAKAVFHGMIREVSLVLAGANPGAVIDNVYLSHADGEMEELEDVAVIHTGLALEHINFPEEPPAVEPPATTEEVIEEKEETVTVLQHAENEETVKDIFDSLSEKQKNVVYFMIGEALENAGIEQSAFDEEGTDDMTRNVFEKGGVSDGPVLSHDDLMEIVEDAQTGRFNGSLRESFIQHAAAYGINDIDILFPDAKALTNTPEFLKRRTEWVADVLSTTNHSPFSRIKSIVADITADEARAKGYVKGNLKKDEIIKLLKRVTTPKTIYKKQKLDRDDVVDITDFDVVVWLKSEMRLMLDEEIARAILIGDGREADDEDKIDEDHLRPIAYDVDMYATSVELDAAANPSVLMDTILRSRTYYKGSGTPSLYTYDKVLTDLLLQKDTLGRRLYATEAELAAALRVDKIVVVEAMEEQSEIFAIMVNLRDYTVGSDKGGSISMFDDFDIDYNQQKYLIETRISGALTKPKAAVVFKVEPTDLVTPANPSFNGPTNTITIPTVTGVEYSINGEVVTGSVVITETTDVEARPTAGYAFPKNTQDNWTFIYVAP